MASWFGDLDARRHRYWVWVLPALLLIIPAAPLVARKILAVAPALIILALAYAIHVREVGEWLTRIRALKLLAVLSVYGLCMVVTAADKHVALSALVPAILVGLYSILNWHVIDQIPMTAHNKNARAFLNGYTIAGLLAVLVVLSTVKLSSLSSFRFEYSRFPIEVNRVVVGLALLLPAVLGVVYTLWSGPIAHRYAITYTLVAIAACFLSFSETAQLSLLVGCASFYAFRAWPWLAPRASAAIIVFVYFLFMPMARLATNAINAYFPKMDPGAYGSARTRLMYWSNAYDRFQDTFFWGGGPNALVMQRLGPDGAALSPASTWRAHPHSSVVQTWLDGGLVGVIVALACILFALSRIDRMQSPRREAAAGILIAFLTAWSGSHGMWQSWFTGLVGFAFAMSALSRPQTEVVADI